MKRKSSRSDRTPRSEPGNSRIDEIIGKGLELTKTVPLQEVSIVRLAREMDLTPGALHYYLDGRQSLTSGIINRFYGEMLLSWPASSDDWQSDLRDVATAIQQCFKRYPGIAAYYVLHNRFDVLIPAIGSADGEAPMQFFENYLSALDRVGLSRERTATYAVILLQFIHITAYATAQHQWPGERSDVKLQIDRYSRKEFPSLSRIGGAFAAVTGDAAFGFGLDLIVAGLAMEWGRNHRQDLAAAT